MTPLPVAILAGGLATRLGAIAQTIPKALLDVAGKPFIVHQLALLQRAGIRRVVLCVAHLADQIEAVLGDGRAFGLDVAYSTTAGSCSAPAARCARRCRCSAIASSCCTAIRILRIDYAGIARSFEASGKLGLMTVFRNDGRYDSSNVSSCATARSCVTTRRPACPT